MKKLLFFITVLIIYISNAYTQPPSIQWQKALGGTNYEQAESVIQTFDGGFVAAGISSSINGNVTGNHGFGDFWIVKLNASGTLLWQKSYGGSGDDGAFSVVQTADSGFAVAGYSLSVNGNVTGNHGSLDYWVTKLNASGNLLWQQSLGGSDNDIVYDIHQTSDLGYIIAGYTISTDGDITVNHGFEDYWIVKLNSAGTLQWQKTFGGSMDERAYAIQQTTDGGYVAGGYTRSTDGDVTGNHGDYDYWIIKLNSIGTLLWQKTLGGTQSDQAHTVLQTSDGGYITAGFTASADGDVTVNHGFEDLWMVKLNSSGVLQWQKSLGGSGVDQAYQIKQLSTGGYVVGGSSFSLNGDVTGNHGGYDFWVARTDNTGNIIWQKSLGGSSIEEAYSLSPTTGNGYIVAGGTDSNDGDVTGNHGDFDYWIVKLNDNIIGLPVELLSFEGINSGGKNELLWSTASEINNDYFAIERSTDGKEFETIGTIKGAGNSIQIISYSSFDNHPINGINYYRLKQIDYNGDYKYSQIIAVRNNGAGSPCFVYEDETAGNFIFSCSNSESMQARILSMQGIIMKVIETTGSQENKIDLHDLGSGMYILRINDGEHVQNIKLIKN